MGNPEYHVCKYLMPFFVPKLHSHKKGFETKLHKVSSHILSAKHHPSVLFLTFLSAVGSPDITTMPLLSPEQVANGTNEESHEIMNK